MRTTAILILSLGALLLLPILVAADENADAIKAFNEAMKNADEATMVREIEALAKTGNPDASKAISKYMGHRQTAVSVAAIKAIGTLKDPSYLGRLMGMVKKVDKDPPVLAAVVGAIGEYGEKKSVKTLVDVAKKWMPKDSDVCSAAARGLGYIRTKDVIDELIKLMDMTFPTSSSSSGTISTEVRDRYAASRPAIVGALQNLTGWDFQDAEAWHRFWDLEQKGWKPPEDKVDLTVLTKWTDPGYGFQIEKPKEKWVFDRGESYKDYRIYLSRRTENMTEAFVYVWAAKNTWGISADGKADDYMDSHRNRYKDIKEETVTKESIRVGKAKGVVQHFTGRDSYGTAAKVREMFFVENGILFIVGSWCRSGLDDKSVEDQTAEVLASFKFLD